MSGHIDIPRLLQMLSLFLLLEWTELRVLWSRWCY